MVLSMAMSGASAPVTLVGTLVFHNSEALGGLVLSQVGRRGTPFVYGSSTTSMDLSNYVQAVFEQENNNVTILLDSYH